jgi:hypothetical protein
VRASTDSYECPQAGRSADGNFRQRKSTFETTFRPYRPPVRGTF